jgi:tetratricopeptide (TPR) repeat protein
MRQIAFTIFIFTALSSCDSKIINNRLGSEGVNLFNKGDYNGALKKFNKLIEIDSLNSEAYLRKADCLDLLGDINGSIICYSKAIEIDAKYKIAYYNRALSNEKAGKLDKAVIDYNSAINSDIENKSDPNNKLIYMNLGILFGQVNQLDNAIMAFNKAILIDNKYADAFYNRGYAYQIKGDHIKAIENFNEAINLNPNEKEYVFSKKRSEEIINK